VIDPAIAYPSPLARPNAGGWATPYLPRIIGLLVLNKIDIHWFDVSMPSCSLCHAATRT
jgi:non-heme chloroperoxidase